MLLLFQCFRRFDSASNMSVPEIAFPNLATNILMQLLPLLIVRQSPLLCDGLRLKN